MTSSDTIIIPSFVKISHFAQDFLAETDMDLILFP
jgi:hypothetical protein